MKQFDLERVVFRRSPRFTLEIDRFVLQAGEKVAVVGPNGSGKTTLLRLLSFLERPDSWTRFLFRGQPYVPGRMDWKGMGFLNQQPHLFRGTVSRNLAYPLKLRRLSSTETDGRVGAMLDLMKLHRLAGARADQLSVGEQRRLALGRALIAGPQTLLLDEPMAHLDTRSRTVMEDVLIRAEETILLTTHDMHFAHRVAHRVLSLKEGRMSDILTVNVIEGRVAEGWLVTGQGLRVALPGATGLVGGGPVTAVIDPRRMVVSLEPPVPGNQNVLRGRVSSIRGQGDDVWLEIDCGARLTAIVSRAAYDGEDLNLHREVVVSFDSDVVEVV